MSGVRSRTVVLSLSTDRKMGQLRFHFSGIGLNRSVSVRYLEPDSKNEIDGRTTLLYILPSRVGYAGIIVRYFRGTMVAHMRYSKFRVWQNSSHEKAPVVCKDLKLCSLTVNYDSNISHSRHTWGCTKSKLFSIERRRYSAFECSRRRPGIRCLNVHAATIDTVHLVATPSHARKVSGF